MITIYVNNNNKKRHQFKLMPGRYGSVNLNDFSYVNFKIKLFCIELKKIILELLVDNREIENVNSVIKL